MGKGRVRHNKVQYVPDEVPQLPEGQVVGDPQMVANSNRWLSEIWGMKQLHALGQIVGAIVCGCHQHKINEDAEFYNLRIPSEAEARQIYNSQHRK